MIHKSDKYIVQWVNIGRVNKDRQTIRRELLDAAEREA
jgi:hypothetical protein